MSAAQRLKKINSKENRVRGKIRIRIRRGIVQINIERASIITIIPIATEIATIAGIKVGIIWLAWTTAMPTETIILDKIIY